MPVVLARAKIRERFPGNVIVEFNGDDSSLNTGGQTPIAFWVSCKPVEELNGIRAWDPDGCPRWSIDGTSKDGRDLSSEVDGYPEFPRKLDALWNRKRLERLRLSLAPSLCKLFKENFGSDQFDVLPKNTSAAMHLLRAACG
jgi:hypothetical protein